MLFNYLFYHDLNFVKLLSKINICNILCQLNKTFYNKKVIMLRQVLQKNNNVDIKLLFFIISYLSLDKYL